MTTLREAVRRLLNRNQEASPPDPEYSYTVYWTKTVRDWGDAQRARALVAVDRLIASSEFVPTAFERRYHDAAIDDTKHSGESILALQKVLRAFVIPSPQGPNSQASDEV